MVSVQYVLFFYFAVLSQFYLRMTYLRQGYLRWRWSVGWHSFCHSVWHSIWHGIYSDIFSAILSGIYCDILFCSLAGIFLVILPGILSDICSDTVSGGRVHLHSVASHVRSALKSLTNLLKFAYSCVADVVNVPSAGLSATRRRTFRGVRTLVVKLLVGALQPARTLTSKKTKKRSLRKPQDKPAFGAKTQLSM